MSAPQNLTAARGVSSGDTPKASGNSLFIWIVTFLPISFLWYQFIDSVAPEWSTNPQYSYGWVVPILCAGLILRRVQMINAGCPRIQQRMSFPVLAPGLLLAFLYLPTHLIQGATPEWRPIQWMLGVESVGLTLCAIYLLMGPKWLKELAFPIGFFLVAVPWVSMIEGPLIQGLTSLTSRVVVELMGCISIPALQHGNVIEVGKGMVGVEEACSGIRSFQTSFMISLFFGEYYRMKVLRRLLLVPFGFAVAMACNIGRVTILTVAAAKKGVSAVGEYHDEAGLSITFVCTAMLWLLAWLMSRKKLEAAPECASSPEPIPGVGSRQFIFASCAVCIWIAMADVGVETWFRSREARIKPGPDWSLNFPKDNPTFKEIAMTDKTRKLLQFDDGEQGEWKDSDGNYWNGFYFNWDAGRVAGYLAKRHTPEICMTAVGNRLVSGPTLSLVRVKGIVLPVRSYLFKTALGPMYVYHCRWEAGVDDDKYVAQDSARFNLIRAIWNGRGKHGQKVIEFMIQGCPDADQAELALKRELEKFIVVKQPAAQARL